MRPEYSVLLSGQIDLLVLLSSLVPYSSDPRGTYWASAAIVHQVYAKSWVDCPPPCLLTRADVGCLPWSYCKTAVPMPNPPVLPHYLVILIPHPFFLLCLSTPLTVFFVTVLPYWSHPAELQWAVMTPSFVQFVDSNVYTLCLISIFPYPLSDPTSEPSIIPCCLDFC